MGKGAGAPGRDRSVAARRGRHGLVVTKWHVVRDARGPINVIFPDGFRSGASLLGTDADWDMSEGALREGLVDLRPQVNV